MMIKNLDVMNVLTSRRDLLAHASPRDDLEVLQPKTRTDHHGDISSFLYATSSLEFAIAHGIQKVIGIPRACILDRYTCFGRSFILCSILHNETRRVLSTEITLYFCEKAPFVFLRQGSPARLAPLLFGLIRRSLDEWVSQNPVKPLFKTRLSLSDMDCTRFVHKNGDSRKAIFWRLLTRKKIDPCVNFPAGFPHHACQNRRLAHGLPRMVAKNRF